MNLVMTRSAHESSIYDEAHRFADIAFPRSLWELGQADLSRITETFRELASEFGAALRLNPSVKYPHPGRSLVKQVGKAVVRVELAVQGPKGFPENPEEFGYVLSVYRTPHQDWLRELFIKRSQRRDPTQWRVVGRYTPAEVREAAVSLRRALAVTARDAFDIGAQRPMRK